MKRAAIILSFAIGTVYATESYAQAASGRVRGYWRFQQYGGGFCRDADPVNPPDLCQDALYLESQYATAQPIRDGKIYVEDENGAAIGSCSTSSTGYYDCSWSRSTMPSQIRTVFYFEQSALRFRVVSGSGTGRYSWRSSYFTVANGENRYIGTITMPKMGISQLFDAGSRIWNDSFRSSVAFAGLYDSGVFEGIRVRAYDSSFCALCTNGFADILVSNSAPAYDTFSVMHEFGHVADYLLNRRWIIIPPSSGSAYCYPETTGKCSHHGNSLEWRGTARAEGFATFLALTAWFGGKSAPEVRSCFGDGEGMPCSALSWEYAEKNTYCSGEVGRTEYASTRYFWDLYDSSNENGDSISVALDQIVEATMEIPAGYNYGQGESFFASNGSSVDAWDSYHQWEWNKQFKTSSGANSDNVYFHNCLGYF